jgi:hypothetical protein
MANPLPEQPGIDRGANAPEAGLSQESPPASAGGSAVTVNHLLWLFGVIFLALAAAALLAYLGASMPPGPRGSMLVAAAIFGLVGLALLSAAACRVWAKHPLPLRLQIGHKAPEAEAPRPKDAKAAFARLQASPRGTGIPLPFFHARCQGLTSTRGPMLYRVYPAEGEFLLIGLGVSTLDRERQARAAGAPAVAVGGLVGGLIAGFNAYALSLGQQTHEIRMKALDRVTDLGVLRQFVDEDPLSCTLALEGVRDLSIDPPSFWDELAQHGDIAAKLRFFHPVRKGMAFDLPSFLDVSTAVAELSPRFGTALQVRVG